MTRKPDPLHNLADALSEDIVAAPADALVRDAAGEPGGADALVASFDRIAARASAQTRRRRIVDRLRALAHVSAKWTPLRRREHAQIRKSAWPAPVGWTSAMAAVAGIFVMVIAGGLYFHQPGAYQPAAPPVVAEQTATQPPPLRDNGLSRAAEQPAVTDRLARTDQAAAEPPAPAAAPPRAAPAPPPAQAGAAGVADEPRRQRTVEARPDTAASQPSTRTARKTAAPQPRGEDRLAALVRAAEQNQASPQFLGPRAVPAAPGASSYVPAAPARSAVVGGLADAPPGFQWPLRGRVIASFGSPIGGAANQGIDLAVAAGTDIHAAEDGVVLYAGNELEDLGNLLLLRHRGGFLTAYAHAQSFAVKPGDTVRRGQVIATSGETGTVTGPQLHFEIRKDDAPVDPANYLPPPG